MERRVIKPIENYLLSSLINTISKTCNDIPTVDAVYLRTYKIDGENRTFVDINVLCTNIEDGYEIHRYFNDMIRIINNKTKFTVNFIPKKSWLAFDKSNIVGGTIVYDRYCALLELKPGEGDDRVFLEPPLQIDKIKSWEQVRPQFLLNTTNQQNKILTLYIDSNVEKLIRNPFVKGIYVVKCFVNGFNRILLEVVVNNEAMIEEIEEQIKNSDMNLPINNLPLKVSIVFGTMKNYNYKFREDTDVFENLRYLTNGEILFDPDGILEELQDFTRSSAYQNYFKPLDYKIDFEPPLELKRIYNNTK